MGYVREDADETAVGWAFGAPGARRDWDEIESVVYCRAYNRERTHATALTDDGRFRFTCTECETEFTA